jgi:transcriptional regulator with XRE-family HTH domain
MESDGHATSRLVAGNFRVLREGSGVSQAKVASEMRVRGWRWHQTTVGRVESGSQPLEVGEAFDLAEVLGVTLERLMAPGEEETEIRVAATAQDELRAAWAGAVRSLRALVAAAAAAQDTLPAARSSRYPRVREIADVTAAVLEEATTEAAVAEAGKAGDS